MAPRTIVISALSGARVTLTASGGPVSWSVTESSGLIGRPSVTPELRPPAGEPEHDGQRQRQRRPPGPVGRAVPATRGAVCVGCQLTINPGGIVVSVIIEIDVSPGSEAATGRPAAGLAN